jgi:hypothetical protein
VSASARRRRVFVLSPANCGGERARLVLDERAGFDLARRVRTPGGAPIGEVFAFVSGLYFRGKLLYALTFANPPEGAEGVLVITPNQGLRPAWEPIGIDRIRRYARTDIDAANPAYRRPLVRDVRRLATAVGPDCDVVLLGSVASGKYVDVLGPLLGERLRFPSSFVGRGDMSRGGLLLRCVRASQELDYVAVNGAVRHGARPPRLEPLR